MKGIIFTSESVKGIIDGRKTQTRRMVTPQPLEESRWRGWLLDSTGKEDSNRIGHACWKCDSIGRDLYVKPRYEVGDVVYVKETWRQEHPLAIQEGRQSKVGSAGIPGPPLVKFEVIYKADGEPLQIWSNRYEEGYPYRTLDGPSDDIARKYPQLRSNYSRRDGKGVQWESSLYMPEQYSRIHIEITGIKAQLVQDITEEEAMAEGIELPIEERGMLTYRDYSIKEEDNEGYNWFRTAKESYQSLWDSINGKKHPWALPQWVFAYTFKKVEEKS